MIVKNEEKYLRCCLDALLPVLRQVDSELIIADTGSTDKTAEIATEFTDQVFSFDWCDDFSAARNATLQRAHGEWFMAVDADEFFEDTSALICFFNSGDYKNYNMATFIQRSITKAGSRVYNDLNVLRLAKRTSEIHYIRAVHEQFNIVQGPIKCLQLFAYHYGYLVSENKEVIERKKKRNMQILLSELAKNPCKAVNYHYLFQLYFMDGQYTEALKCCKTGLQYAKEANGMRQFVFYKNIALIYYCMKEYDHALRIIDTYFSARENPLAFDLEMYCLQGHAFFDSSDFKAAIDAFEAYIKFYNEYKQGFHHGSEILIYTENSSNPLAFRDAVFKLASAYLKESDFPSAKHYAGMIAISDWSADDAYISKRLTLEMDIMNSTLDFSTLPELYRQVSERSRKVLEELIEKSIKKAQCREHILTEFAKADLEASNYTCLMTLRYRFQFCNTDGFTHKEIENFIHSVTVWKPLYADAVYIALRIGSDINLLSQKIDPYDLDVYLFNSPFLHFDDLPQVICDLSQALPAQLPGKLSLSLQIWLSFLYLWALGSGKLSEADVVPLFYAYAQLSAEYIRGVFQGWLITGQNAHLIPKLIRVGYYCSAALQEIDLTQCRNHLRAVVQLYPPLAGVSGIMLGAIYNKQHEGKSKHDPSELEKYATIIKNNIRRFIVSNQLERAEETLLSYEELCPDDAEIADLKMLLK